MTFVGWLGDEPIVTHVVGRRQRLGNQVEVARVLHRFVSRRDRDAGGTHGDVTGILRCIGVDGRRSGDLAYEVGRESPW